MLFAITKITEWYEDRHQEAGDACHMSEGDLMRGKLREYEEKIEGGIWPQLPYTCEAETEDDAIAIYNNKVCDAHYYKASNAEFESRESVAACDMEMATKSLHYAEEKGIIEYRLNGRFMEYWTFYGKSEGWYFVRYDLEKDEEVFRGANIPWDESAEQPIPAFLIAKNGGFMYNYMEG